MVPLPNALFKYVSPERVDVIKTLQIRFTQPSQFNDPFDVLPCIDWRVDGKQIDQAADQVERRRFRSYALRLEREGRTPVAFEDFKDIQARHNRRRIEELRDPARFKEIATAWNQRWWDRVGILSLSAAEKSLLMWAHYTGSHEGMLVEFDPKHPFFSPPGKTPGVDFGTTVEVVYSKARPRVGFGDAAGDAAATLLTLNTKSEDWAYEKEWRVFQLLEKSDAKVVGAAETVHLFNLPPTSMKRVVVGCRMDAARRAELIRALRTNSNLSHVQVCEARLDTDCFGLTYTPLPFH
jgi:hypothetical protein